MRIGILTYHNGINYGAYFQVYSLQKFLIDHGFDCQVINYKNIGFTFREYMTFFGPIHWHPKNLLKGSINKNAKKIISFKKAHKKLNLTQRFYKRGSISKLRFDRIIIGSDEVWNYGTKLIGYDPVYFSKGLNSNRILSYSASFGNKKLSEKIPSELCDLLEKFYNISVRDENSYKIINKILNRKVPITLDPTFLVDLSSEAISTSDSNYILVYGFFNKQMVRQITKYARSVGKNTVSIGYRRDWCDYSFDTISPFQWLGFFKNCECVITTMFHGMIFSILNKKKFCMIKSPYRIYKVGNFLNELGLSKNFIDDNGQICASLKRNVDYNKVHAIIDEKRFISRNYLIEALK